mgnify:FL=1
MEHIKIDRDTLIEHLLTSWRDHYEQMSDDFLITEYTQYLSEDPDARIHIEIVKEE